MSEKPSISGLLNQFEAVGGPEEFGPEGLAILIALWRKSSKLGWRQSFQMTNTELKLQTGIRSRDTINTHRSKLVAAGLIDYSPPPKGASRGDYTISFNLVEVAGEPVQKSDNSMRVNEEPVRKLDTVAPVVVQKSDSFCKVAGEPVQKSDNLADTVLKDSSSITSSSDDIDREFSEVFGSFCSIHQKLDIHVRALDITLMQEMIALGVPSSLIIRVMSQVYQERTARGARITSFAYYKSAILDAWEAEKAITEGVPIPPVALGSPRRKSKQQRELDELEKLREEAIRLEQSGSH